MIDRRSLAFVGALLLLLTILLVPTKVSAAERMVWPPAPDPARIEFVRSFATAEELGIGKGLFARLKDLFLGEAESRLVRPMAVVAHKGVIHVADPGARGVHRFDTTRGDYALIRAAKDTPLPSPVGLARGADGEVYVSDSVLGEVLVIRPDASVATPLKLDVKLTQPTGIAFDNERRQLILVDTGEHCVRFFAPDGRLLQSIGRRGSDTGEFNYPTHLWLTPQGRLFVTDSLNFRIQSFDMKGNFVASFGRQGDGTGDAARQKGVATDSHGHVYVTDALFHALQIFDQRGQLLLPIGGRGREPGEFWLPAGIFIDQAAGDLIYIADSHNRRIQVLRYIGGPT